MTIGSEIDRVYNERKPEKCAFREGMKLYRLFDRVPIGGSVSVIMTIKKDIDKSLKFASKTKNKEYANAVLGSIMQGITQASKTEKSEIPFFCEPCKGLGKCYEQIEDGKQILKPIDSKYDIFKSK